MARPLPDDDVEFHIATVRLIAARHGDRARAMDRPDFIARFIHGRRKARDMADGGRIEVGIDHRREGHASGRHGELARQRRILRQLDRIGLLAAARLGHETVDHAIEVPPVEEAVTRRLPHAGGMVRRNPVGQFDGDGAVLDLDEEQVLRVDCTPVGVGLGHTRRRQTCRRQTCRHEYRCDG